MEHIILLVVGWLCWWTVKLFARGSARAGDMVARFADVGARTKHLNRNMLEMATDGACACANGWLGVAVPGQQLHIRATLQIDHPRDATTTSGPDSAATRAPWRKDMSGSLELRSGLTGGAMPNSPHHSVVLQAAVAMVCAALLTACAAPPPGSLEHKQIQGAINGLGKVLSGVIPVQTAAAGGPQSANPAGIAPPGQGEVVVMDGVVIAISGGRPADARWSGVALRETPLMGIFKDNPLGNCSPCYPRVAIRIKDYSESLRTLPLSLYAQGMAQPIPRPPECVKFDAKIWRSPAKSEDVNNVLVCNGLIQKDDGNWARMHMRNFDLSVAKSPHTQEVRTMGPKAPYRLLGNNTKADKDLWNNGFHLFGNLFLLTGYQGARQIDNIPDDRMWFVNLAELKR